MAKLKYVVGVQSSTYGMAAGHGPASAQGASRDRTATQAAAAGRKTSAACGEATGFVSERRRSAPGELARRNTRYHAFALCRLRVRVAHRDYWRSEPHPEKWLLIEWPKTEKEPTKYWLSNCRQSITSRIWWPRTNCAGASRAITRTEAGTRTGSFSKAGMARISTSCHALHCRLGFLVKSGAPPSSAAAGDPASPTPRRARTPAALTVRTEQHDPSPIAPCAAHAPTGRALPRCPCGLRRPFVMTIQLL